MKRMRTFIIYALLLIGFFALSMFLENILLLSMYSSISGEFDGYYSVTDSKFSIDNVTGKACNINGYLNFDLINTTGSYINNCYLKVELYNEMGLLADTEYIEISNMDLEKSKTFNIKFKANNIEKFNISVVTDMPDKSNIVDVFGWEIDLTNLFGLGIDLTNITIFGKKLTDIFTWANIKATGSSFWAWLVAKLTALSPLEYFIIWWALFF